MKKTLGCVSDAYNGGTQTVFCAIGVIEMPFGGVTIGYGRLASLD